jgi:DNA-directed RNA polymerase subunit K/omega
MDYFDEKENDNDNDDIYEKENDDYEGGEDYEDENNEDDDEEEIENEQEEDDEDDELNEEENMDEHNENFLGGQNENKEQNDDDDDEYENQQKEYENDNEDEIENDDKSQNEDDEEEETDNYFEKFNNEINKNYIKDSHPECIIQNYDEINVLTNIIRDINGIIIDNLHKTIPYLTKYEKTKILGLRAAQINNGAKPYITMSQDLIDGYVIAQEELKQKKIPFILRRPLVGGKMEFWKVSDLEQIDF